jgi:hypothetical protein
MVAIPAFFRQAKWKRAAYAFVLKLQAIYRITMRRPD